MPSYAPISAQNRKIANGKEFDKLIPEPSFSDKTLKKNGNVNDTVQFMLQIIDKCAWQVEKVATKLKGRSTKETCQNIYEFVFKYIKYGLEDGEILRSPRNLWYNAQIMARQYPNDSRYNGDCDCMSIFIGSCLKSLDIKFLLRISGYDPERPNNFGHVYLIVPDGKEKWVMDTVYYGFNLEKTFIKEKTYDMKGNSLSGVDIQFLDGIGAVNSLYGFDTVGEFKTNSEILDYLKLTKFLIERNPSHVKTVTCPTNMVNMLGYAIQYWNTTARTQALHILAEKEIELIGKGTFKGFQGAWQADTSYPANKATEPGTAYFTEYSPNGQSKRYMADLTHGFFQELNNMYGDPVLLGKLFKGKLKAAVKKVATKVKATVSKVASKVMPMGGSTSKLKHALNLVNPLTVVVRASVRVLFGMNLMGASTILADGLLSEADAKAKNLNLVDWKKKADICKKIKNMFYNMGGTESKIEKSIRNGAKRKPLFNKKAKGTATNPEGIIDPESITDIKADMFDNAPVELAADELDGLGALGSATVAASIASGGGVFASIWKWLQASGLLKPENLEKLKAFIDKQKGNVEKVKAGIETVKETAAQFKAMIPGAASQEDAAQQDTGDGTDSGTDSGTDNTDSGTDSGTDGSSGDGANGTDGDPKPSKWANFQATYLKPLGDTIAANKGKAAFIGALAVGGLALAVSPSFRHMVGIGTSSTVSGFGKRKALHRHKKRTHTTKHKKLGMIELS